MSEKQSKGLNRESETPESFQHYVYGMVSGGLASLGLGVGSSLGLFDIMASFSEPKTSQEVADAAGYKERYIREWLGLMAVSNIIEVDSDGKKFFLPPHRKSVLTGPANLAKISEGIVTLAHVRSEILDCFKKDGPNGIPYSSYPNVHDFFDDVNNAAPEIMINDWKKVPKIHKLLEKGVNVIDIGCSTGITTEQLATAYPNSSFTGIDTFKNAIEKAQSRIKSRGLKNVSFIVQDACNMPSDWTNKWDCIFIRDVAHDVPFTCQLLRELYRVLTPGGEILFMEPNLHTNPALNVTNPAARALYSFSLFHCMPVSLSVDGGEGWGAAWGKEKALELLEKAGFTGLKIVHTNPQLYFCVGTKQLKK